ncbi:MAG: FdhF/YdeP family oxidoreductase [Bacteroidetes bacterium]|nr:FdhF/YdeP family oxidoreductase [Bacteroidota bacterium]
MSTIKKAGGWASIAYTLKKSRESGGILAMWRAMRTRNACKTCAVGMGGQKGGMVNESGHFPEFCKKSIQAMAADMQGGIPSHFWSEYPIRRLQQASPRQLEAFGRLTEPVRFRHGQPGYEVISWEEALTAISTKLQLTEPNKSFFYFSGRSSNEAGFLLQLFARLYGTNNVNNCSFYCHQASGVGLNRVLGSGTATVVLKDLDKTDLVVLIGANPASNHPRLMKSFMQIRRRGGKVIVINPIKESGLESFSIPSDPRSLLFGSKIASRMVQPHIGGDLALLTGIAKSLLETRKINYDFVQLHTEGFDAFREEIDRTKWETITQQSGIEKAIIEQVAAEYAESKSTVFAWAMGVTHHLRGTETVQLIATVALLRGMVGREGCGLMPIRGHSNVQGIGSVGVTPVLKKDIYDNLVSEYGVELPTEEGLDTMACIEKAYSGDLEIGLCLGGNLYGSNPDSVFAAKALSKLKFLVTLSTTLNTGHAWALAEETIVLPVLPRDEEPQATTQESMFNYVRMSDGGKPRVDGPRSEVAVIAELAARVQSGGKHPGLHALNWDKLKNTNAIREMIGKVVPGWKAIKTMDQTKTEFHIEGRTFHTPVFSTKNGKAQIFPVKLPPKSEQIAGAFRLMTIRSEGQFNTVVYEDHDDYRGINGRDVVLMHPGDLQSLGLMDGQRVTVHGPAGRMPHVQAISFDRIKKGNVAMYFPESNVLLSRETDSLSKTPGFKGAMVSIHD